MTLCHKLYLYLEMIISQIKWSPTEYFEIFGFQVYIYSLMFILAFLLGYNLVKSFFIKEKVDEKYLDPLLIYLVLSVFLGARLGEVFFYQWGYYQNHLIEILLPIQESPNSSILAVGAVKDEVISENGSFLSCKQVYLTLSVDHRTIDGELGAKFLDRIVFYLQNPTVLMIK